MPLTYITELSRTLVQSGFVLLIQSSLVLLLGLCLGTAVKRRGPLAQSAAFRATLVAVVCTALSSVLFSAHLHPVWRVSLPDATRPSVAVNESTPPQSGSVAGEAPSKLPPIAAFAPLPSAIQRPSSIVTPAAGPSDAPTFLPWTSRLYVTTAIVWGVGSLCLLVSFVLGQWTLRRLQRRSAPVQAEAASAVLTALPGKRVLSLRTSPTVRSPFLAGIRRPVIYLPSSYATDFEAAELQAIVAHEAAHQERHDVAWTLAARLLCALLWPQPLLWILVRRMELAAEEACDVLAVTQGCPPSAYADCLLSLAERLTPSRAERRLGLGVVPFRSQVGRRIQQILSGTPRPRRVSHGLRIGIIMASSIAVAVGLLAIATSRKTDPPKPAGTTEHSYPWGAPDGYLAQFTGADRWKGSVGPIQILPVFDKTVLYPSPLTEDEKTLIRQCKKTGVYNTQYGSGGPSVHDRRVLEAVLARRPHFFYAEYLMGVWYRKSHDLRGAQTWTDRALQDAPVIIAGRVQFADGKPVDGYTFTSSLSLYTSANFMDNHDGYDDAQNLQYPEVLTDAHGCYYLPAFRAVYDQPGWGTSSASPQSATARRATHMDVMSPQTGQGGLRRFTVTGHVGVLPPMIARPYLTVGAPFQPVNQKQDHPLRLPGAALTVTWPHYPGATQYEASLSEVILGPNGNRSETNLNFGGADPHFHGALPTTVLHLPLSGTTPVFDRTRLYSLIIVARDAGGDQLVNSEPYYFRPLSGVAPVPLTEQGLAKIMPPEFVVRAVTKTAQGGVVTGTMPEASNLDTLIERNLFGWKSQTADVHPLYAGGSFTGRDRFRLVYSTTGQAQPASAAATVSTPTGGVIIGRIRYADGRPAPGVTVWAHMGVRSMSEYEAQYEVSGDRSAQGKQDVKGISGADGSFRLIGVEKGHYDIIETESSGKWVAAAQTGIVIRATETVHAPDLVLTRGAVMTGTVYDKQTAKPVIGKSFPAVPGKAFYGPFINVLGPRYPASMGGSSSADVDSHGHYSVRLAPGDNWVFLSGGWESSNIDVDPGNDSNPKYPNYARGFHVLLREGETKTVPINAVRVTPGSHR